jgi:hypothetical protein
MLAILRNICEARKTLKRRRKWEENKEKESRNKGQGQRRHGE